MGNVLRVSALLPDAGALLPLRAAAVVLMVVSTSDLVLGEHLTAAQMVDIGLFAVGIVPVAFRRAA